ncbi:MAG: hypothetical protein ABWY54_00880 [Glaciihabitans sp.]
MSFRTKELLEEWLDEFRSDRNDCDNVTVLMQDGGDGADTGLVYVPLTYAVTDVYMQPVAIGDPHWAIGFGSRSTSFDLKPDELRVLAEELAVASVLCEFLERKSAEHIASH